MKNKLANVFSATHSNTRRVFSFVLGSLVGPVVRLEKDFAGAKARFPDARRGFAPRIQIARHRWSATTIGFDKRMPARRPARSPVDGFGKKLASLFFPI